MSKYLIGVDLGGTNTKAAIYTTQFETVTELSAATKAAKGPAYVLSNIAETVQKLLASVNLSQADIEVMGMGIPGLLDPQAGFSIFSPNFPDWADIPVVDRMKEHFNFPVYMDNDVRVNLYGEWRHGAGAGYQNIFLITLGTGLGSGIVCGGQVLYGTTSSAGEIGHMNMYREGRPCKCGSSGCLGRYASAVGMVNTLLEKLAAGQQSMIQDWVQGDYTHITAKMISDAYDLEDQTAREVMQETGEILGFGLANVINLFNPEIVIVGGGMSAAGERLLGTVRETVHRHALKLSREACRIEPARLGGRAGMFGAATYALDRLQHG